MLEIDGGDGSGTNQHGLGTQVVLMGVREHRLARSQEMCLDCRFKICRTSTQRGNTLSPAIFSKASAPKIN